MPDDILDLTFDAMEPKKECFLLLSLVSLASPLAYPPDLFEFFNLVIIY